MVNVTVTATDDPLRALAFEYAPADARAGLYALFALDSALGQVLRTTREPMVGQMRFAWWREALARLDTAPPPGEPVLRALAADALPRGVTGVALSMLVDGWEPLLGAVDDRAIAAHAQRRGGGLFSHAGAVLGVAATDPVEAAGRGWALADLARHCSDLGLALFARTKAVPLLDAASGKRWSRNGRALGAMAHIARMELAEQTGPSRVVRLAWHRLTGR